MDAERYQVGMPILTSADPVKMPPLDELQRDFDEVTKADNDYLCNYWRRFLKLGPDVSNEQILEMLRIAANEQFFESRIEEERRIKRENREIFGIFRWRYWWDRLLTWMIGKRRC